MGKFTYVYVLQSERDPKHFYTGRTLDLRERLIRHNAGKVPHTAKWRPWRIKTYIAFSDPTRVVEFEQYLKSASGRAFVKKRLRCGLLSMCDKAEGWRIARRVVDSQMTTREPQ